LLLDSLRIPVCLFSLGFPLVLLAFGSSRVFISPCDIPLSFKQIILRLFAVLMFIEKLIFLRLFGLL
jgi:hypothetical protein